MSVIGSMAFEAAARDVIAELKAENKLLREALKPFAAVIDWEDQCREEDRGCRLGLTSLHISTRAFSSGYMLSDEPFRKARAAFKSALREGETDAGR